MKRSLLFLREGLFYRTGLGSWAGHFVRFQSLADEGKILSLSFWRDESAVAEWRNVLEHRIAQKKGKEYLFSSYRIRVAEVIRDYTATDRNEAPTDSNEALK